MERLLSPNLEQDEEQTDLTLRPLTLDEYVGQEEFKENLRVFIHACLMRDEPLDHLLLYGPPGLGKTTLAYVIAHELHSNIKLINGPTIEKPADLAMILTNLNEGDVLFIDEIHRIPRVVEEILYEAMEDYKLTFLLGHDEDARNVSLQLKPFTLVGATTKPGDLTSPLRDRFGITYRLNYYSLDELTKIVKRTGKVFHLPINDEAAQEIAKRSRGTPRIANRIYRRVRDFATFSNLELIDLEATLEALDKLKIDALGLDEIDNRYLNALIKRFNGGPVGLETLASSIGEEVRNLEEVYEPYLLKLGLINKTPRGRVATSKAFDHLKISPFASLFE